MYNDAKVGDIVYTAHNGIYMISEISIDDSCDYVYLATTLDAYYPGALCYYGTEHRTITDLLIQIQEEEPILKIIPGIKLFDFLEKL